MDLKKINPLYWFHKLNSKIGEIERIGMSGLLEMANDLSNENNVIHCKYCGNLLNIIKMPILVKSVKIGETYKIKCSHCKKDNVITKTHKNW